MTELESRTYILLLFVYLVWEVKIRTEIWFEQLLICYSGIFIRNSLTFIGFFEIVDFYIFDKGTRYLDLFSKPSHISSKVTIDNKHFLSLHSI